MKGSRNAIENRGKKTVRTCSKCGAESKPVKCMIGNGRLRMGYQCDCGILNKRGDLMIDTSDWE